MTYGPCIYCGETNYGLSYGGPGICPSCDCGNFGPDAMKRQAATVATLQRELEAVSKLAARLDADLLTVRAELVDAAQKLASAVVELEAVRKERDEARARLNEAIYEVTHLSPERGDGKYRSIISHEKVDAWRRAAALSQPVQPERCPTCNRPSIANDFQPCSDPWHTTVQPVEDARCQHDWATDGMGDYCRYCGKREP